MIACKPRIALDRLTVGKRVYFGWACVGAGCTGFASTPYGAWRNWLMEIRQSRK